MERNLGKMGETQFVYLCNTVDITCTKPEEDKYGWDYYLEFPNEYEKTISKDKQKSPIECKVQIKSTDKNDFKLSVKLSAMFRLVQANMPAFISFLHFNKINNIQEMYLVHIDEKIITEVLKRVRKTELTKKPLNKSSITINYSEKHRVNDISGNGLKNTIKKYIPLGMNEYVIKKNKSLKELGYEGHAFNFNVKFKSTVGDILDMSLGLKDSVDVELGQFLEKRFNISLPIEHPLSNAKSVQFSINPEPIKEIQVVIKQTPISIPLVTYQMKLYNSAFNQFLKGNNYKFLLKNDFFSFCLTNDGLAQKINFHFNDEDKYNLQELNNALKLFYLFKANKDKSLILEIREKNKKMCHFEMKLHINGDFDWSIKAYEYSSYLLKTYSILEINNNNIVLSLDELKYQTGYIECLYYFLTAKPEELKIELNILDESVFKKDIKDYILIVPVGVIFLNKLTGVVFIFHCDKVNLLKNVLTLRGSKINVFEKFEISVDDFNKEEFSNYLNEIVSKYENDDVLCFDIEKWIPKLNTNEVINK